MVNLSKGDTDKPWTPPKDVAIVDVTSQGVSIGDLFDGEKFSKPEPVIVSAPEPKPTLEERVAALEKDVADIKVVVK